MCHIVLNYDLKVVEGTSVEPVMYGFETNVNPMAKVSIRRRSQNA